MELELQIHAKCFICQDLSIVCRLQVVDSIGQGWAREWLMVPKRQKRSGADGEG